MENNNTLREAINKVTIEGILAEKDLQIDEDKEGNTRIRGSLVIEAGEDSSHKVSIYSKKINSKGKESSVFKGLVTVMNEYKSIADVGREDADRVRITQGSFNENTFYNDAGMLISFPKVKANFINRVTDLTTFTPRAEFEVEMSIKAKKFEEKNEEETGRLILTGIIPVYGGRVSIVDFIVEGEDKVNWVDMNYEKGETVKIYGELIHTTEKKVVKKEVAFGEPKEEIFENTTNERLITGGTEAYMEDKAYDLQLLKKALVERDNYLKELKDKNSSNKNSFGSGSSSKSSKRKDDDVPF